MVDKVEIVQIGLSTPQTIVFSWTDALKMKIHQPRPEITFVLQV